MGTLECEDKRSRGESVSERGSEGVPAGVMEGGAMLVDASSM